ncbi:MAG: GNAT family N-acetyltransferase [Motilibacteraceae bacterium]
MLRTTSLRVCGPADLPEVLALLDRDPVTNVFVASRVRAGGLEPWRLGGELWAHVVEGEIAALCYAGANLVPVEAGPEAVRAFAERARRQGRGCSSLVGPADQVLPLWELLAPAWGPAREVRAAQPLMVCDGPPAVAPDPAVRLVRPEELDLLLPASVAMFTEEVGVSPVGADGGTLYRARVGELVQSRRAFARFEHGRVVFKAEVGAVTPHACQVQGVWVAPECRGQGLAAPGMAAVVELARASLAPVVSLYVNDYNAPARAAYRRAGFREVGTFASVLF